MSDVEDWLKSCVSEAGVEESIISKEELLTSFCSWTKTEVGKELFFLIFEYLFPTWATRMSLRH